MVAHSSPSLQQRASSSSCRASRPSPSSTSSAASSRCKTILPETPFARSRSTLHAVWACWSRSSTFRQPRRRAFNLEALCQGLTDLHLERRPRATPMPPTRTPPIPKPSTERGPSRGKRRRRIRLVRTVSLPARMRSRHRQPSPSQDQGSQPRVGPHNLGLHNTRRRNPSTPAELYPPLRRRRKPALKAHRPRQRRPA